MVGDVLTWAKSIRGVGEGRGYILHGPLRCIALISPLPLYRKGLKSPVDPQNKTKEKKKRKRKKQYGGRPIPTTLPLPTSLSNLFSKSFYLSWVCNYILRVFFSLRPSYHL